MAGTFHAASKRIYTWLDKQSHVKEESLTDWLLFNLSEQLPFFLYKAFSRHEESLNGADWECWILVNNRETLCSNRNGDFSAYRFLFQAKKLKRGTDNYPLLSYSNRNGMQFDLLMAEAKRRHALPLYLFYSTQQTDLMEQDLHMPFFSKKFLHACEKCLNGCFVCPAVSVKKILYDGPRIVLNEKSLVNHAFGLSLLDYSLEHGFWHWKKDVSRMFSTLMDDDDNSNVTEARYSGNRHNSDTIPAYVDAMLNSKERDLAWMEKEFEESLRPLAGVVVLDIRDKDTFL